MSAILSMQAVRKEFKTHVALQNVTFQVKEGEIFGFLGPSGAGKTTTIKLLTGQLRATSGEVQVIGEREEGSIRRLSSRIGLLSDTSGLYERMSVFDNLALFADIHGVNRSEIPELLEKVGMAEHMKQEAKKLSRGMKQRLMLARSILHKPALLFLDEPTSSLDPGNTLEIHKLLRKLNKEGTTIFLTTHNMEEADKLCDRVAFLNAGEVVELGVPGELKLKYSDRSVKVVLDGIPEPIYIPSNAEGGSKLQDWMASGKVKAVHSMEPNLETIFLNLTGREL
ncbi:ABC transporter ATP-binding protein [Gorillibacterium timonense]|uniref:ABC transporter ATP-binding protein n=1 Tax=Gorillibacterium timonense TaxID=1689269 RepID=UPI00071DF217|nr:ABC transporter ATP-binding protein [Gorillibacterium timonense]